MHVCNTCMYVPVYPNSYFAGHQSQPLYKKTCVGKGCQKAFYDLKITSVSCGWEFAPNTQFQRKAPMLKRAGVRGRRETQSDFCETELWGGRNVKFKALLWGVLLPLLVHLDRVRCGSRCSGDNIDHPSVLRLWLAQGKCLFLTYMSPVYSMYVSLKLFQRVIEGNITLLLIYTHMFYLILRLQP